MHLNERSVGKFGEAPRDFSFTASRGPYHEDVLGHNVLFQRAGNPVPAPSVPQSNSDCALGIRLHKFTIMCWF